MHRFLEWGLYVVRLQSAILKRGVWIEILRTCRLFFTTMKFMPTPLRRIRTFSRYTLNVSWWSFSTGYTFPVNRKYDYALHKRSFSGPITEYDNGGFFQWFSRFFLMLAIIVKKYAETFFFDCIELKRLKDIFPQSLNIDSLLIYNNNFLTIPTRNIAALHM